MTDFLMLVGAQFFSYDRAHSLLFHRNLLIYNNEYQIMSDITDQELAQNRLDSLLSEHRDLDDVIGH